jgi:hypothetical protein
MTRRFKTNALRSVGGDRLVKYARGKDHFPFRLDQVVDWGEFSPTFLAAYEGRSCRRESPYHPVTPFKMLLLAILRNLSERARHAQCIWCRPMPLSAGLGSTTQGQISRH